MMPIALLGNLIGVELNLVFPSVIILSVLTFVLIYFTYGTFVKGFALRNKKHRMLRAGTLRHSYS